jgi:glycosyltransferase involved in cell wall biosynthesis
VRVSVVIPAFREVGRVGETVSAAGDGLRSAGYEHEILVVDDGSPDATAGEAEAAGARVIRLARNRGKGGALTAGFSAAGGDVLLMLDADLRASAAEAAALLRPVVDGRADMTVATFPRVEGHRGGFGLVMRLARWGLRRAGAPPMGAPLSGQRALSRAAWERIGRLDPGFGLEMGLNLDAARLGLRVVEVPTLMSHRLTGRDLAGWRHRGRQLVAVGMAIARRWRRSPVVMGGAREGSVR